MQLCQRRAGESVERALAILALARSRAREEVAAGDIEISTRRAERQLYAIHNRISLRLGARIWELRHAGWGIETESGRTRNTVSRVVSAPNAKQLTILG